MTSNHPPQEKGPGVSGKALPCALSLAVCPKHVSVCLPPPWPREVAHRDAVPCRLLWQQHGATTVCSAAAAPPWAGAIFSSQEMSQVWGQVDERDGTGDQGYSASLREGVELDIQDLQACSSGCPRCL